MDLGDIEQALEGLRKGLRSDGADLVVDNFSNNRIELSLILEDSACLECIHEPEILLSLTRTALSKAVPMVPVVVLHDPRKEG